jgi:hypothetical protein
MPIPLTITGTVYQYPVVGEDPGWGEDGTAWAVAVTNALNDLLSPSDILETVFNINHGPLTIPITITGLSFSGLVVRAANVDYVIQRPSGTSPNPIVESGTLYATYDAGNLTWNLAQKIHDGSSGVTFSITNTGQVQYLCNNVGGTGPVGTITFRAKTLKI